MGVKFGDIVKPKKIGLEELSNKIVAFDGHNILYQFLAIIRGQAGEPLKDSKGQITSHLSGLLYRNSNLIEAGIKIVYVFDGKPHIFKKEVIENRQEIRTEAKALYNKALKEGDVEKARRFGQQSVTASTDIVSDAKKLLSLMGIPWVQAPSEGEAQAAYMTSKNIVWATASQDFDAILYGTPRLVRNLSISGKRKLPRKNVYIKVEPELIEYHKLINELQLSKDQLIDVAILIGTDYNPNGVKGVGPKTAIKLIKKHGDIKSALTQLPNAEFSHPIDEIKELFLKPVVTDDYILEWNKPDSAGVLTYLCGEHDFSRERVLQAIEKMQKGYLTKSKSTSLDKWLK
ncbi:flap endonuclease-1 [Candidatus Bathyarchaeota archaeon]|nr:flap endonuclease-1 [Candidatus Bathyarchaeota archaeon]